MNNSARHSIMSDAERVKGLLDGSMDPIELEGDSELYSLAERIYGREALDEMGVSAPERSSEVDPAIHSNEGDMDVELPDVPEDQGEVVESARGSSGHRIMLIAGLVGLVIVKPNILNRKIWVDRFEILMLGPWPTLMEKSCVCTF